MILIIGLGNPGKKFQNTRHNIGQRVADVVNSKWQTVNDFSKFRLQKKFNASVSKGKIYNKEIILAKPTTFMNNSGKAVKLLTKPYILDPNNLIIIHDDWDLPLGKIKISKGKGSAGHKGVQSIIDELGTKSFVRFRIGIKPKPYTLNPKTLDEFVLKKFTKREEAIIKKVIKKVLCAIETSLEEGLEKASQKFNI